MMATGVHLFGMVLIAFACLLAYRKTPGWGWFLLVGWLLAF